eukprot:CAMPEP_0184722414 /NCGR_PEP_ID=MMETSP0314-20130426/22016_1 /TAXON_ID=38298 /ORGANISM="Rhodella maculata, Strain CCMP 736" /LENGTH=62 /DNA_ID=CAMNT_0027187001 /DNA_START=297 /DNA_END=485 /DNA_ORIENTATION=+
MAALASVASGLSCACFGGVLLLFIVWPSFLPPASSLPPSTRFPIADGRSANVSFLSRFSGVT